VLYLDADERVTPALSAEIAALFEGSQPNAAGYFVRLDYVFLGRLLRRGHRVQKLALLDRRRARFLDYDDLDAEHMWEVEGHYQPDVAGEVGRLRGTLVHQDHDDLFHYFDRHNKYSDWEATLANKGALTASNETQGVFRRRLKETFFRLPFRGTWFFVYAYLLRLGFLDGRAGLHYALAKSFYYWQVGLKRQEMRERETP
jgi:hypothetical protein